MRQVVIDTDPGIDDAVAILLALASPQEIEVLAITTVAGNVPVSRTTRNALKVIALAGAGTVGDANEQRASSSRIPVYAGAAGPLQGKAISAEHVHGVTGLDGHALPEPVTAAAAGFAPDRIVEIVLSKPAGSVTLCCIGPLTNIALALRQEPTLGARFGEIVIMGGARREGGNITPCAEFNVYADPEAARAVFECGANLTLIPLDCTHRLLTSAARLARLEAPGTPLARTLGDLLRFNKQQNERRCGTDGAPLHDPTTVAYLLQPGLFSGRRVHVAVECDSPLTRGMTVIDWWQVTGRTPNAQVLDEVDADGFFELVWGRLARLA
jgi:purine nucleosidase